MKNFTYYRPATAEAGGRPARRPAGARPNCWPAAPTCSTCKRSTSPSRTRSSACTGIKGLAGINVRPTGAAAPSTIGAGTKLADIAGHAGSAEAISRP